MENENENNQQLPGAIQPPAGQPGAIQPPAGQPGAIQPPAGQPGAIQPTPGAYPSAGYTGAGAVPINSLSYEANGSNAWQQIVNQQQQQINALMAQNSALNGQVVSLVQGGGQLTSAQPMQQMQPIQPQTPMLQPAMPAAPTQIQQMAQLGAQPDQMGMLNPPALADSADYSLESLAEEIGKPNKKDSE